MTSTDESTFVVKNRTDEIVSLPRNQVFALSVGYLSSEESPTFEERLEIVNYVLGHGNDYKGAADKYSVPYASVYQWISKYNKYGESGLSDKRGRPSITKSIKELTSEEKQAIEIERLKRELERRDMIIEVLKKNIEIQEQMERNSRSFGKKTNTKR